MKAALVSSLDGPASIGIAEIARPRADADSILIEVKAVGLSFPDLLQTRGQYQFKAPVPYTPGSEVAGIVAEAPPHAHVSVGDRVVGVARVGGLAEFAVVPIDHSFLIPDDMPFDVAAATPLNYLTSYFGLLERGRLVAGETVLVHGAAGGIGVAAIQICRAFGAAEVIAVTSTPEKGERAVRAGATRWVSAEGFLDAVGRNSVDIVVDPVGGDRVVDSIRALKEFGRHLVIGFTAGAIPNVPFNRLLLSNVDVVGVGWGAYARPKVGHMQKEWNMLLPHFSTRELWPEIGGTFALEDTSAALRMLDERRATGKLVVVL